LLVDSDSHFSRWATRATVNWQPSPDVARVRIHQLHGDRDKIFPVRRTSPDRVIEGAGHVLTATHPADTAEFLIQGMKDHYEAGTTTCA